MGQGCSTTLLVRLEAKTHIPPSAKLKSVPTWKTFVMGFDNCLDAKLGGHCMSEDNLAQMVKAKYGGLTKKRGLGSQIVDTLPTKPNESFESR